ncbi:MAG: 50S ribosomal protein L6 [Micavibrio sp.]|nr:50S ribosomal protein L6 [Micavibrio sp.]
MSRIGKLPVEIPAGVTITLNGQDLMVKGPKGELTLRAHDEVQLKQEENNIVVSPRSPNSQFGRAIWATTRALTQNLVTGVTEGYKKILELKGVGYRANLQGNKLVLALGFSHDVEFMVPQGISMEVDKQTTITISGIDKQLVGETAAKIRKFRPPEPYKGKGVKYADERIIRKEGKKK